MNADRPELTLDSLKAEAIEFSRLKSHEQIPELYGVSDGKAVGTYVESAFIEHLLKRHSFPRGNAASDIDIPSLAVDIKTTSIEKPQSSAPFRNIDQRVYGVGYHLLVFAYEKLDDGACASAWLRFDSVTFIDRKRTGDHRATRAVLHQIANGTDEDDIFALLADMALFDGVDESQLAGLARRIISEPPEQGVLTLSNALQWRISYTKAIAAAREGCVEGVLALA